MAKSLFRNVKLLVLQNEKLLKTPFQVRKISLNLFRNRTYFAIRENVGIEKLF